MTEQYLMRWFASDGEISGLAVFGSAMILYYLFERPRKMAACMGFIILLWMSQGLDDRVPQMTLARIVAMLVFMLWTLYDAWMDRRKSKAAGRTPGDDGEP